MQVLVESKNFDVSAALRKHAEEQAAKVFRLTDHIIAIRVYLETIEKKTNDPAANHVKVVVEIPGNDISIDKQAVDMYEAVGKAFEVAQRHVRKHLEKIQTKRRKSHREAVSDGEVL